MTLPLWGVMMMKEMMMMMIDRNKGNLTLGGVSNKSSKRQVNLLNFYIKLYTFVSIEAKIQ